MDRRQQKRKSCATMIIFGGFIFAILLIMIFSSSGNNDNDSLILYAPSATHPIINTEENTIQPLTPQPTFQATHTAPVIAQSQPTSTTSHNQSNSSLEDWQNLPVIPTIKPATRQIFRMGQEQRNNSQAFSVVGDCLSEPYIFMGIFDYPERYSLSQHQQYLQETIDHFQGSFSRESLAIANGMTPPTALSPLWANPEICESNESPLECELRVHQPIIVFVNLGPNWTRAHYSEPYENYYRQMVEIIINHGAVPILSTKADNHEGNHDINRAIATVAEEFDIPLWNFWLAVQDMEDEGLDMEQDSIYLSPAGYSRHGISGLQVLDSVWKQLTEH